MKTLTPKAGRSAGTPVKFRASESEGEEKPQAVRPQLPRDQSGGGRPTYASGELPKGGFQAMWTFGGKQDTKKSCSTKPGAKIY